MRPWYRRKARPEGVGFVVGENAVHARVVSLSGWIQASAVAAPGFTTKIVRALMLPMRTRPSAVDVTLSG
jgi:hypothetical protein